MHLPADRIVASQRPDETSPRYAGWYVVIVCFVMAVFSWGFGFYGHAVYLAELQRLHGWPASLISGASTLYYLVRDLDAAADRGKPQEVAFPLGT